MLFCEVGSLTGIVDDVDMKILVHLDVIRFQVDVKSNKKFPFIKEFIVKPWVNDEYFSFDKIIENGTAGESFEGALI